MAYAPEVPSNDVPPYLMQDLVSAVTRDLGSGVTITCAQALGTEVYIGCSNGQLMRYALQANNPDEPMSYDLVSRQNIADKPVEDIVLVPSIFRALVFADRQLSIYTLPSLEMTAIKPIRNAVTFAVDNDHLRRPAPDDNQLVPVALTIVKRSGLALFTLSDRLFYQQEIPFQGGLVARRIGQSLCVADKEFFSIVNLEQSVAFQIMPVNQVMDDKPIKPLVLEIHGEDEYLVVSWMGASAMGVFINTNGDPVRGTLEYEEYPVSICMDFPYIVAVLPNNTIVVHNIETQSVVQTIPVPENLHVRALVSCLEGYLVPSNMETEKMRKTSVRLLREPSPPPPTVEE
ncbi:hypothetical protein K525DRAFT_285871 [Schizophyllum commune Loenen D]|nr:hypothetical protein K525DRAFT_285871 [Schizophyllum commune Loenen D]